MYESDNYYRRNKTESHLSGKETEHSKLIQTIIARVSNPRNLIHATILSEDERKSLLDFIILLLYRNPIVYNNFQEDMVDMARVCIDSIKDFLRPIEFDLEEFTDSRLKQHFNRMLFQEDNKPDGFPIKMYNRLEAMNVTFFYTKKTL